jgi:NADH-quinone oxidoreductase subunit G
MAVLYIDNKPYQFTEGGNLLHTCLGLGFTIPYFCWHPAMDSIGACRQCAVKLFKDENDTKGIIVMSCMTSAKDNMRISIDDHEVLEFRAQVIAFLMANHPHDCPVCDEGGECHLQDMTVLTGHTYREHRFKKRTHRNQDLGPFVHHEMNRCIACYRCVRFYRDYAGGRDLNVFGWHDSVYFGRQESGVLESEFAGNLIEVCPTGVFTDKTFRKHFTRKWDLATSPSVCVHCSLGCNTIAGERSGTLRRILNRYNPDVNGYFLCDRGRFGYEFVNGRYRVRTALARKGRSQTLEPIETPSAMKRIANAVSGARCIIGIGSGRASLESNYALRELVGQEHFFMAESEAKHLVTSEIIKSLRATPAHRATLGSVAESGAVLLLGEDVTNTAPMLGLAIRRSGHATAVTNALAQGIDPFNDAAVREANNNALPILFVATPTPTRLDDIATVVYHAPPEDIARLGFAIAHALDSSAQQPQGLSNDILEMSEIIAQGLSRVIRPTVVSGAGSGSVSVVQAASSIAESLHKVKQDAQMCMTLCECNSFGCWLLGGRDLSAASACMTSENADVVIVLENDVFRHCDPAIADALLTKPETVIVVDHTLTDTAKMADIVLPAATFAEASGTLVNNEGRFQRFFNPISPRGAVAASFAWLRDMMEVKRPKERHWATLDDIIKDIAISLPDCAGIRDAAPDASFRNRGQKVARQSFRASGRAALVANHAVAEQQNPIDLDSPLSFSSEGIQSPYEQALFARYWAPGINSASAVVSRESRGSASFAFKENPQSEVVAHAKGIPAAFSPHAFESYVVPLYHIYGSEELSMLSPPVASLAHSPIVVLNPVDAGKLSIKENDVVEISNTSLSCTCAVVLESWVAPGSAALSAGLAQIRGIDLPQWLWINKSGAS